MMVHAFICWALTVYLVEMRDFGDWPAVQEYFKAFITDCSSPFCFSAGAPYFPIRDKVMQVQADCCDGSCRRSTRSSCTTCRCPSSATRRCPSSPEDSEADQDDKLPITQQPCCGNVINK
jgi:hypothetical protein